MAHRLTLINAPGFESDLKFPSELRKVAGYRARVAELIIDEGNDCSAASSLLHDVQSLLAAAEAAEQGDTVEVSNCFLDVCNLARQARALRHAIAGVKEVVDLGSEFPVLEELVFGLEQALDELARRRARESEEALNRVLEANLRESAEWSVAHGFTTSTNPDVQPYIDELLRGTTLKDVAGAAATQLIAKGTKGRRTKPRRGGVRARAAKKAVA